MAISVKRALELIEWLDLIAFFTRSVSVIAFMKTILTSLACLSLAGFSLAEEDPSVEKINMSPAADAVSLFDGESLTHWKPKKGDEAFWSVKGGEICGGNLKKNVPRNVWLISDKNYENFELTFAVKFTDGGGPGLKNSGVQVRSLPDSKGICGYQIDAGPTRDDKVINDGLGYWGNIWDEHRRGGIVVAENQEQLMASIKQYDGWNYYKVICNGTSIKTWINGILAHDYVEENPKVAADGILALQAHRGGKFLVHFKDIAIKEFSPTEGSPKWTDKGILKGRTKKGKKGKGKKKAPAQN